MVRLVKIDTDDGDHYYICDGCETPMLIEDGTAFSRSAILISEYYCRVRPIYCPKCGRKFTKYRQNW